MNNDTAAQPTNGVITPDLRPRIDDKEDGGDISHRPSILV